MRIILLFLTENKILVLLHLLFLKEFALKGAIKAFIPYDQPLTFGHFCKKFYIVYFSLHIHFL